MSLDDLLLPLADNGPGGVSLLHEPEYDAIAAAREEDDPSLPLGVWTSEPKRADWPEVVRLCETALRERSKDLQIAAWLGEAWIAQDGLAGGLRATQLMQGLCARFWDDLHPLPRGGDMEFRTAPFDWADEHWSAALMLRVTLVNGQGPDGATVTLAQWDEAAVAGNNQLKTKKPGGSEQAASPHHRILAQRAGEAAPDLRARLEQTETWRAALDRLPASAGPDHSVPRLSRLAAVLDRFAEVLRGGDIALPPPAPIADPAPPAIAGAASGDAAPPVPVPPAISGRDEAYRQLGLIADYLARTEPHSPVPALLRRAVAWGHLPFQALMEELTHNSNEMQTLLLRKPIG